MFVSCDCINQQIIAHKYWWNHNKSDTQYLQLSNLTSAGTEKLSLQTGLSHLYSFPVSLPHRKTAEISARNHPTRGIGRNPTPPLRSSPQCARISGILRGQWEALKYRGIKFTLWNQKNLRSSYFNIVETWCTESGKWKLRRENHNICTANADFQNLFNELII